MLFFKLAGHRVLVTEDEVNLEQHSAQTNRKPLNPHLVPGASQIRAKHDHPRCRVRKLLAAGLESILEQLDIPTTTVPALLVLHLVLHHEGLVLEVHRGRKGGRDGVVGGLGLGDERLLASDERRLGVLDLPFADVRKGLTADGGLFRRLGGRPAFRPVIGELFDEWGGDFRRLGAR